MLNKSYAMLVVNTVESDQRCSPELIRLSKYLSANGIQATKEPTVVDIEIEQEIDAEYYQVGSEDEQMSTISQASSRFRARNTASATRR